MLLWWVEVPEIAFGWLQQSTIDILQPWLLAAFRSWFILTLTLALILLVSVRWNKQYLHQRSFTSSHRRENTHIHTHARTRLMALRDPAGVNDWSTECTEWDSAWLTDLWWRWVCERSAFVHWRPCTCCDIQQTTAARRTHSWRTPPTQSPASHIPHPRSISRHLNSFLYVSVTMIHTCHITYNCISQNMNKFHSSLHAVSHFTRT